MLVSPDFQIRHPWISIDSHEHAQKSTTCHVWGALFHPASQNNDSAGSILRLGLCARRRGDVGGPPSASFRAAGGTADETTETSSSSGGSSLANGSTTSGLSGHFVQLGWKPVHKYARRIRETSMEYIVLAWLSQMRSGKS